MITTGHHGTIGFSETFGSVVLTETRYHSVRRLQPHAHGYAAFCLVLSGSYEERFRSARFSAVPSTLLFRPAGEVHEDLIQSAEVLCFIAEVSADRIADAVGGRLTAPAVVRNGAATATAFRLRQEIAQPDDLTPFAVDALMCELVVASARQSGRRADSRLVKRATTLLDERFRESISLRDVAAALETPAAHLASQFRSVCGCSVGDYVRRRRVECAAAMLVSSDAPLVDVALAAGFAHQSHLCRVFKRALGVTPAAYRRQAT
jgi:AraC family transcriptional regulator